MKLSRIPHPVQIGIVVAFVYAINWAIAAWIYCAGDERRMTHSGNAILEYVEVVAFACLVSEIGCLALWTCLSTRKTTVKLAVYVAVILQLAHLRAYAAWPSTLNAWDELGYWETYIIAAFILMLIGIAVRVFPKRISLVKLSDDDQATSLERNSIAEALFVIAIMAAFLAGPSIKDIPWDRLENVLMSVGISSCLAVLSVIVGVVITRMTKSLIAQIAVCVVIASMLVAILMLKAAIDDNLPENPRVVLTAISVLVWPGLLPILWIWVLGRLGYVVRCVDRMPLQNVSPLIASESEGA